MSRFQDVSPTPTGFQDIKDYKIGLNEGGKLFRVGCGFQSCKKRRVEFRHTEVYFLILFSDCCGSFDRRKIQECNS